VTDRPEDDRDQNELVLDWDDDAVESFRLEIESSARAEAAPFPQRAALDPAPAASPEAREYPTLAPPSDPAPDADGEPQTRTVTLAPARLASLPPPSPRESTNQRALPFRPSLPSPGVGSGLPGAARGGTHAGGRLPGMPPPPPAPGNLRPGTDRATMRPGASQESAPPAHISGAPLEADFGGTSEPGAANDGESLSKRLEAPASRARTSIPEPPARPSAPQGTPRPSAPEGRPRMYEPPSPREVEALIASSPDREALELDDDDDADATQVASIPRELIESLLNRSRENENRATERPPPPAPGAAVEPEIAAASEQELDDALSDLDWASAREDNDNAPEEARVTLPGPRAIPPLPPPAPLRVSRMPTLPPAAAHARAHDEAPQARGSLRSSTTETSVLRGLEELLPPVTVAPPPAVSEPQQPRTDRGATAAARTVGARKAQTGYGALSALDDSGKRARIELLRALAQQKSERQRAALLTCAGELAEELRDLDTANALYALAHEAHSKLLGPLRSLARLAFERRDFEAYLAWLEREADATESVRGRALVQASIARGRWLLSRDLDAALEAAAAAARLDPDEFAHKLLLARLTLAARPQQADTDLVALAGPLEDDALAAALLSSVARGREQRGDDAGAKQLYRSACERSPRAVGAQLGRARMARAERATGESAEALLATLPALGVGALTEAVRRHAAVLLATDPARRADAVSLLDEAGDGVSLRTAFALASGLSDRPAQERAALAWTTHSDGSERALALVAQAEQLIDAGRGATAAPLLAEALRVDRGLSLAKVLWESLARESGDVRSFLEGALPESAERDLRGAAKLAFDAQGAQAEIELLARKQDADDAACSRALLLDARAELRELSGLRTQLERAVEQRPSPTTLLALADFARRRLSAEDATRTLRHALELHPESALVTRACLRAASGRGDQVDALISEAAASRGARAAFLYVLAGQLEEEPTARLMAFERAHDALPSYAPAVFALHAEARKQNELERLSNLHARESSRAKDPFEAVSHLVRAALVRAQADGDAAAAQLSRAMDLAPADPVLRELVIRLGDAIPASLRAEALQRSAERALAPFDRPATLAAAGAFEDAGQAERALGLYEDVLRSHPEDAIAELGRERVARAAGKTRELLDAKRRAVSEASTDAARIRALEELLQADSDTPREEALDRARALLVLSPAHPLALRKTEQHAMERADNAALFDAELRLFNSSTGSKDKLARLRTLWLLTSLRTRERARADELDTMIVESAPHSYGGPWLARQLMGAGVVLSDPRALLASIEMLSGETSDAVEQTALAVQRARLELAEPPHDREAKLKACFEAYPEHPTAREALAELAIARGDLRSAAALLSEAAQQALHKPRKARLWARAGKLYREELAEPEQARLSYTKAAEADVTFGDVESKLRAVLAEQDDQEGLITLLKSRLDAESPPAGAPELRLSLAALQEKRGDTRQAIATLRETLSETLEDLPTLRELSRLLARAGDHRERAQILLRIARVSREPVELRDVFMQLGEIYDRELPDPKRAEAAYQRALKLGPKHAPALERLAALYGRDGQHDNAIATLTKLVQVVEPGPRKIEVTLELARAKEKRSDLRGAEEVLEQARRDAPLEPEVLSAMAEFYRRQGALSALAMHLNRAGSELRIALERDPSRSAVWATLVQMLEEKQRPDAARVVASLARACGASHQRIDARGDVPGVAGAGFSELLDDLVFSDSLPASTRIVFRHGAEALNKAIPFDLRAVGGERLDKRHPLRAVIQEVGRWAGLSEIEVFTSNQPPLAFVPIGDAPVQLLVGRTLLENLSRDEQVFLTARALKIARAHMSITCRVRPDEMGLLVHGLIRSQLPNYAPSGLDLAALDELSRRIGKHLSRRNLPELTPSLIELAGISGFEPARIYTVASAAGNRAGLLATGSIRAALSALTRLAGLPVPDAFDRGVLAQVDEARELLNFALSEAHFEARLRAGADQR
jgi:cellulose synthase operon protein C